MNIVINCSPSFSIPDVIKFLKFSHSSMWYFIMVLMCIFLMTYYFKELYVCFFAICKSSLVKFVYKHFVLFLFLFFIFLLSFKNSFIRKIPQLFSSILWLALLVSYSIFWSANILNFNEIKFIHFVNGFCFLCYNQEMFTLPEVTNILSLVFFLIFILSPLHLNLSFISSKIFCIEVKI